MERVALGHLNGEQLMHQVYQILLVVQIFQVLQINLNGGVQNFKFVIIVKFIRELEVKDAEQQNPEPVHLGFFTEFERLVLLQLGEELGGENLGDFGIEDEVRGEHQQVVLGAHLQVVEVQVAELVVLVRLDHIEKLLD